MSKKILIPIIIIIAIVLGIGALFILIPGKEKNIEGTLEDIMEKVYAGIAEDELPMMLANMEVTSDTVEYYLGTADIEFKEALVSESEANSIAHSVVLVRLNDASKAEETVTKIKENVDPRKWICVEASNVVVKSKGDLVILIMSNETLTPRLETNFEGLE